MRLARFVLTVGLAGLLVGPAVAGDERERSISGLKAAAFDYLRSQYPNWEISSAGVRVEEAADMPEYLFAARTYTQHVSPELHIYTKGWERHCIIRLKIWRKDYRVKELSRRSPSANTKC